MNSLCSDLYDKEIFFLYIRDKMDITELHVVSAVHFPKWPMCFTKEQA